MTAEQFAWQRSAAIPGRSLTRSKAPGAMFAPFSGPMFAQGGEGGHVVDVSGRSYLDMLCALGAVSLGYDYAMTSPRRVYSLPHVAEGRAADAVLGAVARWATQVRFTKTGSEATHAAYRVAKRLTGRRRVLVGDWAFHGWHEWCDERHGSALETDRAEALPLDALPERTTLTYGLGEDLSHLSDDFARGVAAVFFEPPRWALHTQVLVEWARGLRDWCDRVGALFVVDEMIAGGRWALGGATERWGLRPHLACFGKAIGNGAPVACVVGGLELADHGTVASGTYSGDVDGLDAVVDTLRAYQCRQVIDTLWARGGHLWGAVAEAVAASPVLARVEGLPVHLRVVVAGDADGALGRQLAAGMARRGILWHPACANVCAAHRAYEMSAVGEALAEALAELKSEVVA